ncbi:unnamed protein product, partial [Iphiclides podalirius]
MGRVRQRGRRGVCQSLATVRHHTVYGLQWYGRLCARAYHHCSGTRQSVDRSGCVVGLCVRATLAACGRTLSGDAGVRLQPPLPRLSFVPRHLLPSQELSTSDPRYHSSGVTRVCWLQKR